jgi:hypothetical protein
LADRPVTLCAYKADWRGRRIEKIGAYRAIGPAYLFGVSPARIMVWKFLDKSIIDIHHVQECAPQKSNRQCRWTNGATPDHLAFGP